MKKWMLIILASAVISVSLNSLAGAFTMSEKVVVSNQLIAIARVPAGGFTADQRVNKVNERLAYILGYESLVPSDIRAVRMGSSRAIMVGNRLLITVTPRDARANGTSVEGLTQVWLRYARQALPQARPQANVNVAENR